MLRKWHRQGAASVPGQQAPARLGALLHYDPGLPANVDIGAGGISDFRPALGSPTLDVLSQPTPAMQPTYNTPGTFASGRNTISMNRAAAQVLKNTAMASLGVLDSPSPWTICCVGRVNGVPVGYQTLAAVGDTSSALMNILTYTQAGLRPTTRYRDLVGIKESVSPIPALPLGTIFWTIGDYDGVDTMTMQNSTGGMATTLGAAAIAAAVFDSLTYGGGPFGNSDMEQGDLVLFSRKLNVADRAEMVAFLAGRL